MFDLAAVKAGPNVPPKGTLIYIDRAFSVKGVGVVVLGFVLGGKVSVHDELRLIPSTDEKRAEVRGIQVSDVDQESVGRGLRVGLSLKGVELKDLDKVSWMDDGSFQVSERVSFSFRQSRFYKQAVDGRDMHLQLPGEILTVQAQGGRARERARHGLASGGRARLGGDAGRGRRSEREGPAGGGRRDLPRQS